MCKNGSRTRTIPLGKMSLDALKEYIEDEEYKDCFVLRDQAKARKAESKKFDELMSKIDYVYEYGFDAYDEVSVYSNGWCAVKTEDLWGYANEKGETKITAESVSYTHLTLPTNSRV